MNYKAFIEDNLEIVNKKLETVPFILNAPQNKINASLKGKDIILKARQEGFSSFIAAMFTADFILTPNSYSVIVADIDDNSQMLLEKVKGYIKSYERHNMVKVPLKYNSKTELFNPFMNSRYNIGTARNTEFGRSRTISNLHLSEVAFFSNIENIIAGAGQAVIPGGKFVLETTANGFNDFKDMWERSKRGETGFTTHFFKASEFYSVEFLKEKAVELGRKYKQEYPETDIEAFVASGECYFNTEGLQWHYDRAIKPGVNVANSVGLC